MGVVQAGGGIQTRPPPLVVISSTAIFPGGRTTTTTTTTTITTTITTKPLSLSSLSYSNKKEKKKKNYYYGQGQILAISGPPHSSIFRVNSSSSSLNATTASNQLAVLLELEGVLMDVYGVGNREAFNLAFKKLGLDCAHWTEPIYLDLQRKSFGGEEEMLTLYFNKIGWPTSLPTNEKGSFMKSVLREKKNALEDLVMSKSLPLRPGAEDFIKDAHKEGVPVVVLAAYGKSGENISRAIIEKLGEDWMSKIKIIGKSEVEQSFYGQLVFGKGVSSSLDEQLLNEARKAASTEKQKIAKEVASVLKLSVDIDTTSSESIQKVVAALRAGAEYADVPVPNCVLVAGSLPGVTAAEQIGMPCVVLRSRSTSRAEFPSANAVMDSFGAPDLTISRLRLMRSS